MDIKKELGEKIKRIRKQRGLTQEELAEMVDISPRSLSNIEVGEAVWMEGHIGVYIGDGLAVECTPKWANKVQITSCNQSVTGYNRRDWTKHGKLPYIEYLKAQEEKLPVFEHLDVVKIKSGVTRYSNGKTMFLNKDFEYV